MLCTEVIDIFKNGRLTKLKKIRNKKSWHSKHKLELKANLSNGTKHKAGNQVLSIS